MMTGEAAFLGFSPSDILVGFTRVSAIPISPIGQGTFAWPNFFTLKKILKFSMIFYTFFPSYLSEFLSLRLLMQSLQQCHVLLQIVIKK